MRTYVIYHKGCMDGFAAAASIWMHRTAAENDKTTYIAMNYGQDLPSIDPGSSLIFADFCLKRPVMENLLERVNNITVLDHHKTQAADMEGLKHPKLHTVFNMDHSGAYLSWVWAAHDHDQNIPDLIRYIEDRDLWRWALPKSKEVSAYLWSLSWIDMDFYIAASEFADAAISNDEYFLAEAKRGGYDILRYMQSQVKFQTGPDRAKIIEFSFPNGHWLRGLCVNAANLMSEIGEELCNYADFGCSWYQRSDGKYIYSLRSRNDVDVSEIARFYGGGGHKHAAGFESKERVW